MTPTIHDRAESAWTAVVEAACEQEEPLSDDVAVDIIEAAMRKLLRDVGKELGDRYQSPTAFRLLVGLASEGEGESR